MADAKKRIEIRNRAKRLLTQVLEQPDTVNIIHYSCEGFYDNPDGGSRRIVAIAVRHVGSHQTPTFSILKSSEIMKLPPSTIKENYNRIERQMLDEFYKYVKVNISRKWIHWNMLDSNYGFLAIDHRYKVLGGSPTTIPEVNLFDLNSIFSDIYGHGYIAQPRFYNLMKLNEISEMNYISGSEEAECFKRQEFLKINHSTSKKVDVIHNLVARQLTGTLKTTASWKSQYGTSIEAVVERVTEHWIYKILGLAGIVASLRELSSVVRGGG